MEYRINSMKKNVMMVGPNLDDSGGICSVLKAYSRTYIWKKYQIEILNPYGPRKVFSFLKAVFTFLVKRRKPDIVHLHIGGPVSLIRKGFFVFLCKIYRKKIILHIHNIRTIKYIINSPKIFKKYFSFLLNCSNNVIVLSNSMKIVLKSLNIIPVIKILPNPCVNFSNQKKIINNDKKNVFFAGKICKDKGSYDLINAFKKISQWNPNSKLIMAGDGDGDEIFKLAFDAGLQSSIEMIGLIDEKKMEREYLNATVFCLPSYHEGMPMVLIEAMSFGIPVVTTPVGVITDFITNDKNGILVPVGNVKLLSDSINKLLKDGELRKKIGDAGRQYVRENLSLPIVTRKLDEIYRLI